MALTKLGAGAFLGTVIQAVVSSSADQVMTSSSFADIPNGGHQII